MDNATRRQLLQRHRQSGFPGSILDVYKAYDQGIDLLGQFGQQNNIQVAQTPQQMQQGLRPAHQAGNVNQSMAFPNVPPNASFNTVGMKSPIDIKQFSPQGNLVRSFDAVPPGVTNLKMGSEGGMVLETPAQMKNGGVRKAQNGLPPFSLEQQPIQAESTFRPNYGEQAFLNQINATPKLQTPEVDAFGNEVTDSQLYAREHGTITQAPDKDPETMPVYRMLAEPMKALKYWGSDYNRERGMPTQAEWAAYGNTNPYDLVTSMYNPAQVLVDSENQEGALAGLGAIGGLATADDLFRSADTFKRFGINTSYDAGQLARNVRNGSTEGIAGELTEAAGIINQGADNAKSFYQNARPGFSPPSEGRYYLDRLADNTLANHPQLAATYRPEMMGSQATIDAADDFAKKYLTSYRGVRAENAEQAAEYLTSPFGGGNRAFGQGIYSTYNPDAVKQYGNFVGELIADPHFTLGNDPRHTMGRLDFLRTQGGQFQPTMTDVLGSNLQNKLANTLDLGASASEDVKYALKGRSGASFLSQQYLPDLRTGFLDDAGQRVQRGTGPDRLKPRLVQVAGREEFTPTVNAIWGERMNMGTGLSPEFADPTQMFFKARGFQKYGGVRKYQAGTPPLFGIDSELLKSGIAGTESSGGIHMMNPGSTATGLYGQRFSEIRDSYPGTREEFSTNIAAQDSIFDRRLYQGLNDERSMMDNIQHMYETYPDQIAEKGYNAEQVAGIINMLGRQGTRKYLGYVVRDKRDLAEVFPDTYGPNIPESQKNKTPDEYAQTMQWWMDRYAEDNCPGGECMKTTQKRGGRLGIKKYFKLRK